MDRRRAWIVGLFGGPAVAGVSVALSPMIAMGMVLGLIAASILLMLPLSGLFLTVLVIPLERIGRFSNDSSMVTFSLMRVVGLATLGAWGIRIVLNREKFRWNLPLTLYTTFLVCGVFTLTYTTDFKSGVRAIGAMSGNLMFLFLVYNLVRKLDHVKAAIAVWLCVSVGVAGFTAYQWHRNKGRVAEDRFASTGERTSEDRFSTILEEASEYEMSSKMPRAMGPTSHPAVYAINNILTLPFFAWWMTRRIRWYWRAAAAIGCVLVVYNILLTNTRAALISLAVTGLMLFTVKLVKLNAKLIGVAVLAGICVIPVIPQALWDRIFDPSNYTAQRSATLRARLIYWQAGMDIITENPLTGIGLGNQAEIPKRIKHIISMPENSTVHNEYIQSMMEVGLLISPILFTFLALVFYRIYVAARNFRRVEDEDSARLLAAMMVCMAATLAYGLQVDVLHFPLKGWWLVAGLGLCLYDFSRKAIKQGEHS